MSTGEKVNREHFVTRLRSGETLIGTLLSLNSPEIAEAMREVGYDWLFIDAEHGAFLPQDAIGMLQAAAPCPCVIRVPAAEEIWVKKALDIGADGIIVPMVHDAEQAQEIISWAKYSPDGKRGVGIGRAHEYGLGFEHTINYANHETAIILQAESRQAIENIEQIANVEGVDAILIGPYDLSASLGKIGQVQDDEVQSAIRSIHAACQEAGVQTGIFGVTAAAVKPWMETGFNLITVGVDVGFVTASASQTLAELKA